MKNIFLVMSGVAILICIVLFFLNFVFSITPFGSEHCPGLELRKSLGLVDLTARCL